MLVEKGQLQQERISSEEEKLKVSKVLVDLQIENASLLEQAVDKEFQVFFFVLRLEILQLEEAPVRTKCLPGWWGYTRD